MGLRPMKTSAAAGKRARGFTLIELMVAMVIASIIMAAIYSVYAGLTRSYTTQNVAADVQQAVRATIDFMAEDIMMAGLRDHYKDYAGDVGISLAGRRDLSFTADLNMDGDTDDAFENITYRLVGTQLRQTSHLGTETLIDNVDNFEFRYFRENAADTPTNNDLINDFDLIDYHGLEDPADYLKADSLSDIRTVEISITVSEPAGRDDELVRTYTTRVRCRNAGL